MRVNVSLLQFQDLYKIFFVRVLIETNVNLNNGLYFSDVYQSVNYIWALAKLTCTLHSTQCSLHFDKHLKKKKKSIP